MIKQEPVKIFFTRFFLALCGIMVSLVALESGLRLVGWIYVTQRQRADSASHFENIKSKGNFTIVCLGDSYTFGVGTDARNSYPRQLRRLLQDKGRGDVKVIEAGECGFNSSQSLKKMRRYIDEYRPDMFVILTGMSNCWNFKDSSYFILENGKFAVHDYVDKLFYWSSVYKMLKIIYEDRILKNRPRMPLINAGGENNIKPESMNCFCLADALFLEGKIDAAILKHKEAISLDRNNYYAHIGLSALLISRGEERPAREEVWKGLIYAKGDIDDLTFYRVLNVIFYLEDVSLIKPELVRIMKYYQDCNPHGQYNGRIQTIHAVLEFMNNRETLNRVLEYDLGKMCGLAREKNIKIVLQTYPVGNYSNGIARKISRKYSVPLVDNEMVFQIKSGMADRNKFFAADKHCNAAGYRLMAENVRGLLFRENLLGGNK